MNLYQILVLLCMGLASEASYLWHIKPPKGKGVVSYLFGSIHVPHAKVYPSLADEVKEAFKKSDACGFETDETDSRYKKRNPDGQLLDNYLSEMAVSQGKSIHALETFEEYSKNNGMFTEMLYKGAQALEDVEEGEILEEITENLLGGNDIQDVSVSDLPLIVLERGEEKILPKYLKGELTAPFNPLLGIEELPAGFYQEVIEPLYAKLMKRRNGRMAERIVELTLEDNEKVFFFAAGVQHLLGEEKIQDALEAAGYAIKRVGGEGDAKESAARKSDEL